MRTEPLAVDLCSMGPLEAGRFAALELLSSFLCEAHWNKALKYYTIFVELRNQIMDHGINLYSVFLICCLQWSLTDGLFACYGL